MDTTFHTLKQNNLSLRVNEFTFRLFFFTSSFFHNFHRIIIQLFYYSKGETYNQYRKEPRGDRLNKKIENGALFIWIVATLATLGSLYYSEIKHFVPCTYCWYQRILMYPLILIVGVAIAQKNERFAPTVMVFSGLGSLLALYHYALQKLPLLQSTGGSCGGGVSCTAQYVNYFGFITIPFLSLLAFLTIFITSTYIWRQTKGTIS